jgi:hypothetical protein
MENDMFFTASLKSNEFQSESKIKWTLIDQRFLSTLDILSRQSLKAICKMRGANF